MSIISRQFDSIESAYDGALDIMQALTEKFGPEYTEHSPDSDWACGAYHDESGEDTGYWVEFPGETIGQICRVNFVLSEQATRALELEKELEEDAARLENPLKGFTQDIGQWYQSGLPDCSPLDIPDIGQTFARRTHDGMSVMYRFTELPVDYSLAGDGMPMTKTGMLCLGFNEDDLRHCRMNGPIGWQRTYNSSVSMFLYAGGGNYSWEIAYCPLVGQSVRGS